MSNLAPWGQPYLLDIYNPKEKRRLQYAPGSQAHMDFHTADEDNVALIGTRGSAKSWTFRHDAHMRALMFPNFYYAMIRRTVPQLRKNHVKFLYGEQKALGAQFNATNNELHYHNGSIGYYFSCDDENALENVLGAEFGALYVDEAPTIPWTWLTQLASAVRVPAGMPYKAIVRLGGNPIGTSIIDIHRYYLTKRVAAEDDPEYDPDEYRMIRVRMQDNPFTDVEKYRKKFAGQPKHIRKAWLDGEFSFGGLYFEDFNKELHVLDHCPPLGGLKGRSAPIIYRAVDWGWSPDPAVCLWIAVYDDGHEVVFKEREWRSTTAEGVARAIARDSEGLPIRATFCDPTMFKGEREMGTSIGRIFGQNGVPLTPAINDRAQAGVAIHEHIGRYVTEQVPQAQFYAAGCPQLIEQFQSLQPNKNDPRRIGDGYDHSVIAFAYFCMSDVKRPFTKTQQQQLSQILYPGATTTSRIGTESTRYSLRH